MTTQASQNGVWYWGASWLGEEEAVRGFTRIDGDKARVEAAKRMTERLGVEIKPGHLTPFWVADPSPPDHGGLAVPVSVGPRP